MTTYRKTSAPYTELDLPTLSKHYEWIMEERTDMPEEDGIGVWLRLRHTSKLARALWGESFREEYVWPATDGKITEAAYAMWAKLTGESTPTTKYSGRYKEQSA